MVQYKTVGTNGHYLKESTKFIIELKKKKGIAYFKKLHAAEVFPKIQRNHSAIIHQHWKKIAAVYSCEWKSSSIFKTGDGNIVFQIDDAKTQHYNLFLESVAFLKMWGQKQPKGKSQFQSKSGEKLSDS